AWRFESVLDQPFMGLRLHRAASGCRPLRDEKHLPIVFARQIVQPLDRAVLQRLQRRPEIRRALYRAPDTLAMMGGHPADGAAIVRPTLEIGVLLGFARFRLGMLG